MCFRHMLLILYDGGAVAIPNLQFQIKATLGAKEYFLKLFVALCVKTSLGFPLGPIFGAISFQSSRNWVALLSYMPFMILCASIMSPLNLRYDSVGNFSSLSLSGYRLSFKPGNCLVAFLCTCLAYMDYKLIWHNLGAFLPGLYITV